MGVTLGNGGGYSNAVDMYNSASGTWSTAQLSVARGNLAATSVGSVALFAGGLGGNCSFALCDRGVVSEMLSMDDDWLRFVFVAALLCMRCEGLPSDEDHCRLRLRRVQCCGHVQQCIGHMVDCSAQCGAPLACGDICWERGPLRGGLRR